MGKSMNRKERGAKLVYLSKDRLEAIKNLAKMDSLEKNRSISANDVILDAIDKYLQERYN